MKSDRSFSIKNQRNYFKLFVFVVTTSLFLSVIVTSISVIFFPPQEMLLLKNHNHLLTIKVASLEKEISIYNEKIELIDKYRSIPIAIRNPKDILLTSEKINEHTNFAFCNKE